MNKIIFYATASELDTATEKSITNESSTTLVSTKKSSNNESSPWKSVVRNPEKSKYNSGCRHSK